MTKRSSHICRLTLNSAFILNMAEETLSYESQGISLIIITIIIEYGIVWVQCKSLHLKEEFRPKLISCHYFLILIFMNIS